MLVTLKNILKIAVATKTAVGSFNTPNYESLRAVIGAAEELGSPVVIMHAQLHEDMNICRLDDIGPLMLAEADKAKVPVCVHLDHGTDLDYLRRGLKLGFTSVMYDGSEDENAGPEMNVINTRILVEEAAKYGASVEAEVGSMGSREDAKVFEESIYTDPDEAKKFVDETGVDALACAFGTAHGRVVEGAQLDFERVKKLDELLPVPIVMHGGSGVSAEDYKKLIACGVRKVNYYTRMAKVGTSAVEEMVGKSKFFHDFALAAESAIKEDVKQAIRIFEAK